MKNKTGTEETDPYNASRPLGGIDVPCTDPGAMSHEFEEPSPIEAKVREEHALRAVTERWYQMGWDEGREDAMKRIKTTESLMRKAQQDHEQCEQLRVKDYERIKALEDMLREGRLIVISHNHMLAQAEWLNQWADKAETLINKGE